MRPIYIILRLTLPVAYTIFFRNRRMLNDTKKMWARTIFVSNHPSAFLDPPLIASLGKPIVYFMTRSDVFKPWLKPITWACHMVPIYRAEQDGAGTYEKNQQVFRSVRKVLKRGGSLIMFGEGYTDNVFIRSLKPLKKGPSRIGFGTMEATDWELDIKIQPLAVNYTDPNAFRSEIVVSYAEPIHLLDYKELFDENPNKAHLQLKRRIEKEIRANLTCLDDKSKSDFLERLLILSKKGMNHEHADNSISLENRFYFSRDLANRINEEFESNEAWQHLEKSCEDYFNELKSRNVTEKQVVTFERRKGKKLFLNWLYLILTLPIFILGTVHSAIPYFLTKYTVESIFKRRVFWSGVKLLLGCLVWVLYNLPIFWLFPDLIYEPYNLPALTEFLISFNYFLLVIPSTFIIWYNWKKKFIQTIKFGKASKKNLSEMISHRNKVVQEMNALGI